MIGAHQPVFFEEAIQALNIVPNGIYIDGTFGRGGHARAILDALGPEGRLIALDKDEDAIRHAEAYFSDDPRFTIIHDSFANINEVTRKLDVYGQVSGILLDLGVSSPQLDEAERGFSFMRAGPLDMRMDVTQNMNAEIFVNQTAEADMADIFKEYGEERYARRISRAIGRARSEERITTTTALAEIVKEAHPAWGKHKHPATRVFQAIRIYVNEELTDLNKGLKRCLEVLAADGRLAVISFHSLEDRIVKRFMRAEAEGPRFPRGVPVMNEMLKTNFKCVGKAIKPSDEEIKRNIRSRSAILRIGEKTS
jgi:16S rRNA (cytosine1402-N4)-methyltransferase